MQIAVNTRLLLKNKLEGIGWFSYETLKRLTIQHPEHHFIFIFDRDFDEEFIFSDNITPIIVSPQARHPVLFYWWFEISVRNLLDKLKPDLFLSPDGYLSLSANIKQLAVIHDLNFVHYQKDLPWLMSKYYNYYFPRFAHKATRIATVSEFSKQDIITQFKISSDKIDVVYNGSNKMFAPLNLSQQQATRDKFSKGKSYFLFLGSLHPRKNIVNLFSSFDEFKNNSESDVQLLMVGEKYYWTSEMRDCFEKMKFKNDVIFTGRLYDENLKNIVGSALALTYISYFEGFGIPIIEAMSCDVPVITSNVTSMPEVAGDAALLVNPFSVDEIKNAMLKIYKDEVFRNQLIEKGKIQKEKFSWDKTADKLWESIEKSTK